MDWRYKLQRKTAGTLALAGALLVFLAVPAMASAELVNDLLHNLGLGGVGKQLGVSGGGSNSPSTGTGTATGERGGTPSVPPGYTPPLHGTNPHGQGTAAAIDAPPTQDQPIATGGPGPELLVVGRARGEQNADGTYHGHITIAALAGNEILGVNSTPGQDNHSPLDPLNTQALDAICNGSGGQLCLGLLVADSSTSATGSTNHFSTATAHVGPPVGGIDVTGVQSTGDISQTSSCQTASGSTNIAHANVAGQLTADALQTNSSSTACNDGTAPSTTQSSKVVNLAGTGVPIPAAGCDNGTPNTAFTALSPIIETVCNASDDGSGGQASGGSYGVREDLTAFLLTLVPGGGLGKAAAGPSESRAVAPAAVTNPPANPGGNPLSAPGGGNQNNNNGGGNPNDNGNGGGNSSTASNAGAGNGSLAFTGLDLIWVAMLGFGLIGAGMALAAMTPASRRPALEA